MKISYRFIDKYENYNISLVEAKTFTEMWRKLLINCTDNCANINFTSLTSCEVNYYGDTYYYSVLEKQKISRVYLDNIEDADYWCIMEMFEDFKHYLDISIDEYYGSVECPTDILSDLLEYLNKADISYNTVENLSIMR